mmetsp:Transcript_124/g.345  ORF Transcript_124/g.345 Transcript_124/m.345 type:complete len:323 (-) Transcript_124:2131-3099(-)
MWFMTIAVFVVVVASIKWVATLVGELLQRSSGKISPAGWESNTAVLGEVETTRRGEKIVFRRLAWDEVEAVSHMLADANRYAAPMVDILGAWAPVPPASSPFSLPYTYTKRERQERARLFGVDRGVSLGRLDWQDNGPEVTKRLRPLATLYRTNLLLMPNNDGLIVGFLEDEHGTRLDHRPVCFFALLDPTVDPLSVSVWKLFVDGLVLAVRECGFTTLIRALSTNSTIENYEAAALLCLKGRPYTRLERVAVAPAYQGRGIGTRMMAIIMRMIRERGTPVYLTTQNEYTVASYARLGFRHLRLDQIKGAEITYPSWSMLLP